MTSDRTAIEEGRAPGCDASGTRLFVLTGKPGSGKTTRCRELARVACEAGLLVRGVVAVDQQGDSGGSERWLEDLATGERRLLGHKAAPDAVPSGTSRWRLSDVTLDWCTAILKEACPADLLVVDEVGPVELLQQRGALAGVRRALAGPYGMAVVVVRPWLVRRFLEVFPHPPAEVVGVLDGDTLREAVVSLPPTAVAAIGRRVEVAGAKE